MEAGQCGQNGDLVIDRVIAESLFGLESVTSRYLLMGVLPARVWDKNFENVTISLVEVKKSFSF